MKLIILYITGIVLYEGLSQYAYDLDVHVPCRYRNAPYLVKNVSVIHILLININCLTQ